MNLVRLLTLGFDPFLWENVPFYHLVVFLDFFQMVFLAVVDFGHIDES